MKNFHGKKINIIAMGCRTNLYEAEAAASLLEADGAVFVDDAANADGVVIMSCAVTGMAAAKTRKLVRRLRRDRADAVIAVCGCWSQLAGDDEARDLGADIVLGNRKKHEIVDALDRAFGQGSDRQFQRSVTAIDTDTHWDSLSLDMPRVHTRAFVKVQDGCSRSCSYCVIPLARGASVSRDPDDTVAEVRRIAASGCREVILTGVHLGSYKFGTRGLAALIERISSVAGITRLRLGSIEPFSLSEDLLIALRDSEIFCPYLHVPLQSGDDGILSAMRRGMTASGFAKMVELAREILGDDLHIGTDLIVGFPGETEDAFERSLSLMRGVGIGRAHVFPFSSREGTDAASMAGTVPAVQIADRVDRALAASGEMLSALAHRSIGTECEILVEELCDGRASGWTRNYVRADVKSGAAIKGSEIRFIPTEELGGTLWGDAMEDQRVG